MCTEDLNQNLQKLIMNSSRLYHYGKKTQIAAYIAEPIPPIAACIQAEIPTAPVACKTENRPLVAPPYNVP